MSDNPNESRKRASLRGKGWQILRGALRPDNGLDEEELEAAAKPEVERAGAVSEKPVGSDALQDMMGAPEFTKLRDMAMPSPGNEFDNIDDMDQEFGLGALESGMLDQDAQFEDYDGEARPPVEATISAAPRVAEPYQPKGEVDELIPVEPEFLLADELFEAFVPEDDAQLAASEVNESLVAADELISATSLDSVKPDRPSAEDLFREAKDHEPDGVLLGRFVTDARLEKLWNDIEQLQEEVIEKVQGDRELTDTYQRELLQASALLIENRANYDDAKAIFYRVRADLAREEKIRVDIRKYKPAILIFLTLALILWGVLMGLEPLFGEFLASIGMGPVSVMYHPTLFGMLGAIVYAYFTFHKHAIQQRDFDPVHLSWYLMNPIIGIVMGLLMTLVFGAGIVSTIGVGLVDQGQGQMMGQYPFLLWVLCFLAGYNQNVVLRLMTRAFSLMRGSDAEATPPPM